MMMEFESSGTGSNENDPMNSHKRTSCELVEDSETKKSKLDTSCDETVGTVASSKNPVSDCSCQRNEWWLQVFGLHF